MKIKEDFVLRKVADSYVVVPVNQMSLDFNGIINSLDLANLRILLLG